MITTYNIIFFFKVTRDLFRISKCIHSLLALTLFVISFPAVKISCQTGSDNNLLQYISPLNGSAYVTTESSIIIRYSRKVLGESISDSLIKVTGSIKGSYRGKLKLCRDGKTLIFEHAEPFEFSERITVTMLDGLYTAGRKIIKGFNFYFYVTGNKRNDSYSYEGKIDNADNEIPEKPYLYKWRVESCSPDLKSTQNDFPTVYSLRNDNPSDGYHFLEKNYIGYCYIMIIDNYGTPLFYRKLEHNAHNFSLQPAGCLSYFIENQRCYAILDSLYNFTGTYKMKNGYYADSHDFILLENGHSFMIAYDRQLIGMDTVIEGGSPDATVVGLVIQELDEDQNLIFQWRSWDHFSILDTDESVIDLTSQYVDYVHGNSLDIDSDTSLLLSSRNLNEVTKIHRQTGEIIWRLGGKNNQFTFINDSRGFALQHSAKKLENNNLILFDNGKIGVADYSRGIEYELDETNYTAHLVNEFKHDSSVFAIVSGHMQRLSNGNTLISWGKNLGKYVSTEFKPDGTITNDLYTDYSVQSYRVYKFEWRSKTIELNKEILLFKTIEPYNTDIKEIKITNLSSETLVLNSYIKGRTPFYVLTSFPIMIPEDSTRILQIKFAPNDTGEFNDIFTIYSDGLSDNNEIQRIGAQFIIIGVSSADITQEKKVLSDQNNEILLYPNPVSNYLRLANTDNIISMEIRSINGELINLKKIQDNNMTVINCSALAPGIYLLNITDNSGFSFSTKFIKK
jgi:hypothetical protein